MAYGIQSSIAAVITFFLLSWVFGLLRCYVRLIMVRSFWLDDWFALASLVLLIGPVTCYLIGIYHYDLDRDIHVFTNPVTLKHALATVFFPELFYTIGTALIKISFGLTLLRVLRHRGQRIAAQAIMTLVALFSIIFFFYFLFYCSPVSYAWRRGEDPYYLMFLSGKDPAAAGVKPWGTCKSNSDITNWNYAHAGIMVIADIALGIVLPVLLIRDLHMKRSLKMSTCAVLAFGGLASLATIIRLPYLHLLSVDTNFFQAANPVLVWSYLEYSLCIIGAACSTLKPLAKKIRLITDPTGQDYEGKTPKLGSSNHSTKSKLKSRSRAEGDFELLDASTNVWTGATTKDLSAKVETSKASTGGSEEELVPVDRNFKGARTGINRTVEVHHTYA